MKLHLGAQWPRYACRVLAILMLGTLPVACAGGARATAIDPDVEAVQVGGLIGGGPVDVSSEPALVDSAVTAAPDAVWSVLPAVLETLGIEPERMQSSSLTIMSENVVVRRIGPDRRRLSNYFNCGSGIGGPNADRYEVRVSLMVQLGGAPGGGTRVRTVLDAYASPREVRGSALHCTSRGTLERQVIDLIQSMAGG